MTAVEWLIEELKGPYVKGDFIFNGVITSELIEQAKAMEKEQIGYSEEDVRQAQQAILGNIKDALMNKDYIIEYLNQNKTKTRTN